MLAEWNACRQWLAPAMDGDPEEGDLINDLILGRAQIWRGERGAFVTQLINENGQRLLHVLLGGGDLLELLQMQVGIAAWGRTMGAHWATIKGRKGWTKALAPFGFTPRDGELWKALQ